MYDEKTITLLILLADIGADGVVGEVYGRKLTRPYHRVNMPKGLDTFLYLPRFTDKRCIHVN